MFAWSILLRPVGADLGIPTDRLGSIFSLALACFALAVLLGGRSVDRHGPRRGAALAGVLSGSGLAVAAAAPGPVLLHTGYGLLFGLGSGLAYLSTVTWASARTSGPRAFATAVVVASYAAGPVVAAPLGVWAVDRWGWRATLALAGATVGLVSLVASRALPGPVMRRPVQAAAGTPVDGVALAALWVLFLAAAAPGLLAFGYATEVGVERGASPAAAALVVALMSAGNLTGRLLAAPLARRLGAPVALWLDLGLLVLALPALAWPLPLGVAMAGLVLLAGQYGLVSALLPLATWRVSGDASFGTAYGRVFSSFGVAGLAGPALGALLHESGDGYAGGFRASLVAAVGAALALVVYRRRTPG